MAYVTTVKPYGVYYRYDGTSKWQNAPRLWDNDDTTYPNVQSGNIALRLDMSWLPVNMKITKITVKYVYNRKDSGMSPCGLYYTNRASYSASYPPTKLMDVSLPAGNYNTRESHNATVVLTEAESDAFTGAPYQLIYVGCGLLSTGYELTLDVEFEEKGRNLYAGGKLASEVYVGDTKATAVYIGDTKVL